MLVNLKISTSNLFQNMLPRIACWYNWNYFTLLLIFKRYHWQSIVTKLIIAYMMKRITDNLICFFLLKPNLALLIIILYSFLVSNAIVFWKFLSHLYLISCDNFESTIFGPHVLKKSITPTFKKKLSFNLRWCQVAVPGGVTFICIQYPLHSPNQYSIECFRMVTSITEFSLGYLCNFIVIRGNRGIYGVRFLYLFNYSFSFLSASRVSRNKCF